MAEDVPDGFPEERCKASSADDDGTGVDVGHERYCVGDATNAKISERSADSEIVCWCWRTKGSRTVVSKASKESSAEDVCMVSANPSGIESRVAMAVFVFLGVLSRKSCLDRSDMHRSGVRIQKWQRCASHDMSHDVLFTCCDEGIEVCVYEHEVRGNPVSMDRW